MKRLKLGRPSSFRYGVDKLLTGGFLAVSIAASHADANLNVTVPPPFPPQPPSLNGDSHVSYHYRFAGTGYWQGDPEYITIGLVSAVEESTDRTHQDGSWSSSSRSVSYDIGFTHQFCDFPPDSAWYYQTGCNTNYDSTFPGSPPGTPCQAEAGWYDDPCGIGPGMDIYGSDITDGPTTTNLNCGTFTTGRSKYETMTNPGGGGGACGRTPNCLVSGSGLIYEITLELTSDCPDNSIPGLPSSIGPCYNWVQPSRSSMTPNSGSFVSNGGFQFTFKGSANVGYGVHASTDLESWAMLGTVWISGSDTQGVFLDVDATSYSQRFYIIDDGTTNCSGAFGFLKKSLSVGTNVIANPLLTSSFQIGNLLSSVPT